MSKITESAVSGQDQFLDSAQSLRDYLQSSVRQALRCVIEQDVTALCGDRHKPDDASDYYRAGSAQSYVMAHGKHEPMERPRVRERQGDGSSKEVSLRSWKLAQSQDDWEDAMMHATLCGVSTRSIPSLRESEVARESRSSISRLWQEKSAALVGQVQDSDLSDFNVVVLMLDAVALSDGLVATVALGINTDGQKRILGFRVGNSENQQVCEDMLGHLSRRGFKVTPGRRLLAVLDGSLALKNALLSHFPNALIQRCLVHKERNLKGYLSKRHWAELNRLFARLRKSQGAEDAKDAADAIAAFLADKNAQARTSFEEAGSELLTLARLEVTNELSVSLLSTNCIENVFKNLRLHIGRVSRWRESTDQADRWLATGFILTQQGFHRIKGYNKLPDLVAALELKASIILEEKAA
jgi:transposase-like protein